MGSIREIGAPDMWLDEETDRQIGWFIWMWHEWNQNLTEVISILYLFNTYKVSLNVSMWAILRKTVNTYTCIII